MFVRLLSFKSMPSLNQEYDVACFISQERVILSPLQPLIFFKGVMIDNDSRGLRS